MPLKKLLSLLRLPSEYYLITAPVYFSNNPVAYSIIVIENNYNFDFSIFPNPSTGEVNISFTLKEEMEIKIELYNSLGQIVKTISKQKFTKGENQISFSTENISKGIYHIKFSVDENVVMRKLVKM